MTQIDQLRKQLADVYYKLSGAAPKREEIQDAKDIVSTIISSLGSGEEEPKVATYHVEHKGKLKAVFFDEKDAKEYIKIETDSPAARVLEVIKLLNPDAPSKPQGHSSGEDMLVTGQSVELDGERISPRDFYKLPESRSVQHMADELNTIGDRLHAKHMGSGVTLKDEAKALYLIAVDMLIDDIKRTPDIKELQEKMREAWGYKPVKTDRDRNNIIDVLIAAIMPHISKPVSTLSKTQGHSSGEVSDSYVLDVTKHGTKTTVGDIRKWLTHTMPSEEMDGEKVHNLWCLLAKEYVEVLLKNISPPTVDADVVERVAKIAHDTYEAAALRNGWITQEASRVPYEELPSANKETLLETIKAVLRAVPGIKLEGDA